VKKFFAISFLFIYLFSSTELSQLLKTPLLVEHFIEHREENKHLTLWQFLHTHYAAGDVKDADYDKDMKLPFKSHDNCVANVLNVYLPIQKVTLAKPFRFIENNYSKPQEQFLHSSFLSNIWQPPKSC
jgi:hypothetical protein